METSLKGTFEKKIMAQMVIYHLLGVFSQPNCTTLQSELTIEQRVEFSGRTLAWHAKGPGSSLQHQKE